MTTTTNPTEASALPAPACPACGTAYASDALFCDHCGAAAAALPVPVSAPSLPVTLDKAAPPASETLGKLRDLVRDKTRFEPEDVQPLAEDDAAHPYRMVVRYALEARCEERSITGHFKPAPGDIRSARVGLAAAEERAQKPAFLRNALAKLERQLRDPGTRYDTVEEGLYLGAQARRYALQTCGDCDGEGKNECHTCRGCGSETCWKCQGGLYISCNNFACLFGKVNCGACSGLGTISRSESYQEAVQVATTVYHDGNSSTSYHTEYQTHYRQVTDTCYACSWGKVDCGTCHGTAQIRCTTCHAVGTIVCRTCGGSGDLVCSPCAGSGKVGDAAWTDVHLQPAYAIDLPEDMPEDARQVVQREGPHGLAGQAAAMALLGLASGGASALTAEYAMPVRLVRLAAECGEVCYDIVAYGRELRWLTLDDIVEDLLQRDLRVLTGALARMADDGLFAADIGKLLEPLRHVAASELNADVVEAVLDGDAGKAHAGVISADYAATIESALLGALRHVCTRFAKQGWWHGVLMAVLLALGGWLWAGRVAGVLCGALALPASLWLFRRRLRTVLGTALGGEGKAGRALALARKGRRDRTAHFLVLAPVVLVLALGAWGLPLRGPWAGAQTVPAETAETASVPAAEREAVAAAMREYAAGHLGRAREMLEPLAQTGNGAAYGPYGWMVLLGEGLRDWQTRGDDMRERVAAAGAWADKAVALDDTWGHATQGMIQVNRGGGHFDMAQGLRKLELAAGRGHLGAMHFLGTIHYKGVNVPVDYAQARKWFQMGAQREEPTALYNLGLMDWTGAGIARPDRGGAMRLWRRAAALGNDSARKAVAKGRPAD